VRLRETVLASVIAILAPACSGASMGVASPEMTAIVGKGDALAISDALEALIAEGKDSRRDRELALDAITAHPENTAAYAFARAAVTGRVVQVRGVFSAANLVREVEHWSEVSRKLDPNFRDGAATRMLGTLYVMAPSSLVEHGTSEDGFELLEGLANRAPNVVENQLRLGEAYVAQGDKASAVPYLCRCLARKAALRHDDQALLDHLFADAGNPQCPGTPHP
jgi:hypothetical protein